MAHKFVMKKGRGSAVLNELSLFSGAGGGLLATKHLLGWKTIGYVEIDEYCQAVLAQRIEDGYLDPAPIFGDIRRFIEEGYAEAYQGMVDVVTAGFPCQPFSVAGRREGDADKRNQWPNTIECVRLVRPKYIFLENVPGLLAHEYIRRIYGDLAEAGCNARWCVLGADDCGAPHRRKRWWLVADSSWAGRQQIPRSAYGDESENEGRTEKKTDKPSSDGKRSGKTNMAHSDGGRC